MEKEERVATTGDRIRIAMNNKGMKQIDLVNATGLDKSRISNYLSGKYEPKQLAINKLAIALDVNEMWLWGLDVPMERSKAQKNNDAIADIVTKMRNDEVFLSVVKSLNELDDEKLKSVAEMLKAFAK